MDLIDDPYFKVHLFFLQLHFSLHTFHHHHHFRYHNYKVWGKKVIQFYFSAISALSLDNATSDDCCTWMRRVKESDFEMSQVYFFLSWLQFQLFQVLHDYSLFLFLTLSLSFDQNNQIFASNFTFTFSLNFQFHSFPQQFSGIKRVRERDRGWSVSSETEPRMNCPKHEIKIKSWFLGKLLWLNHDSFFSFPKGFFDLDNYFDHFPNDFLMTMMMITWLPEITLKKVWLLSFLSYFFTLLHCSTQFLGEGVPWIVSEQRIGIFFFFFFPTLYFEPEPSWIWLT